MIYFKNIRNMAILSFVVTFIILLVVFAVSNKIVANHRSYGKITIPTGVPKTFLTLIALTFAVACIWQFALDTLHDMESPEFWISAFSADPILGEVFDAAEQYDMDLGIPGAEFRPNDLLMMQNVSKCISVTSWCAVASLGVYAVYLAGIFKENRLTLIISLSLFAIILFVCGRSAVLGMVHLSDWVFSGMGNGYDGDISDSATLQPLSIMIAVIAIIGLIRGISQVNPFMEFATSMNDYATTHISGNLQSDENEGNLQINVSSDDGRSKAEKLTDLKGLMDAGIITEEEFVNMKRKILNS